MGEPTRLAETRSGQVSEIDSNIYYFTPEELDRGHRRRLDALAGDVARLAPDIVFFQEVGAGAFDGADSHFAGVSSARDCAAFHDRTRGDRFDANSVLRVALRLNARSGPHYEALLGCRGNTGWITDAKTFADHRIVADRPGKGREVIFDFGANPYPNGIIVEGTAILVRSDWKVLDQNEWTLPINAEGWTFFAQSAALQTPAGDWLLAVNVHASWNTLQHFEQAVALRRQIVRYLQSERVRGFTSRLRFSGVLIGGDFNQTLLKPAEEPGSPATVPWQVAVPGQFDYRWSEGADWPAALAQDLGYGGQSSGRDESSRAQAAVDAFIALQKSWPADIGHSLFLREAFDSALAQGACAPLDWMTGACAFGDRIDLLYTDPSFQVLNSFIAYSKNNWSTLQSLTDHPGLVVRLTSR